MSDTEQPYPVVMDAGTAMVRAGFAGDDAPRAVFPTRAARPDLPRFAPTPAVARVHKQRWSYIGDQAQRRRGFLSLTKPITRGIVTNWDAMEAIWTHCFETELSIDSTQHHQLEHVKTLY